MFTSEVFRDGYKEATRADGWVADHVRRSRGYQFNHQSNNMPRGPKLSVLTGRRDLREHVFVHVALGIATFYRHGVEFGDRLLQKCRRGNREARIFHVLCEGRVVAAERAQEWENVLVHDREH